MLNILLILLLCGTPYKPAQPYSTYTDRQPVHCTYQDSNYLACYDTQTSSSYFYLPDSVDPSQEGYSCFFVSRNYDNYTDSYACFDIVGSSGQGQLVDGWIVRDYPDSLVP